MNASKSIKTRLAKLEAKSTARSCETLLLRFDVDSALPDARGSQFLSVKFVQAPTIPSASAGKVDRD